MTTPNNMIPTGKFGPDSHKGRPVRVRHVVTRSHLLRAAVNLVPTEIDVEDEVAQVSMELGPQRIWDEVKTRLAMDGDAWTAYGDENDRDDVVWDACSAWLDEHMPEWNESP